MTAVLVYLAILRVIDRDYYIDADAMLITASCGVVFNMIIGCVLHRCGVDGHSHGDFSSSDIPAEQDFSPAIGHNDRVSIVGAGAGEQAPVPLDFAYKKLEADLRRIQGVRAIHDLHVWALTVGKVVINAHLAVDADHEFYEVQCEASRLLRFKYHAWYSTVQVEPYDRHIMAICKECSSLER
ncbi:hypothetical protein D917_00666 [Trichinella nativa]|uniref:Cation efflux protein cytoplasmic domain-containing protein n=1 Tax=Trichinella nativa TaxID=6335 RepID=A0A1Y3E668_9BILA|nr:hypothetical protein D917_00666 [Trichinella nativa]